MPPAHKRSVQSIRWPDTCPDLIQTLNGLFTQAIDGPFTFDQLRTLESLRSLVVQLRKCRAPCLIFALLCCKLSFAARADGDETTADWARGDGCEIAAMRLLRKYTSAEVLTALTHDFHATDAQDERTPLLSSLDHHADLENAPRRSKIGGDSFTALEVAIVAQAKHFTSAHVVQDVLTGIWQGDIIFWHDISEHGRKKAQFYQKQQQQGDARLCNFARLRVPQYAFVMESFNFCILAALYLLVVADREYRDLGWIEVLLASWFLGITYQEYDQFREAGTVSFYFANPFNYFDLGMIVVALAWIVLRVIGIAQQNPAMVGHSYDVLSLQGVLLAPRLFSFLSLSPYFGTLFPCLRRLTIDFLKFLVLIVALYAGFLLTFSILGRNHYSVAQVSWLLIRVFFGGSGIGFDAMDSLHPIFGPPLMIFFVTLSQILLTTALISILSASFSKMMDNARGEYLFLFATTCLEASKSDHMVILTPPFNLIGLLLVRPLRLFLPSHHVVLQQVKIWILRLTHFPYVLIFSLYEMSPFAPTTSDALRQRLEQSNGTLRPIRGHVAETDLNAFDRLRPLVYSAAEHDTDDEEGLDTGVMISGCGGALDEETKAKIDSIERQMVDMKRLLEALAATKDKP